MPLKLGPEERERIRFRALVHGQGSASKCTLYAWAIAPLLSGGHQPSAEFVEGVARMVQAAQSEARSHGDFSWAELEIIARKTLQRLCGLAEQHGEAEHRDAWMHVLRGGNPDRPAHATPVRVGMPY